MKKTFELERDDDMSKVYCSRCEKYHCGMCMHNENLNTIKVKGTWLNSPSLRRVEKKRACRINKNNDCMWYVGDE